MRPRRGGSRGHALVHDHDHGPGVRRLRVAPCRVRGLYLGAGVVLAASLVETGAEVTVTGVS